MSRSSDKAVETRRRVLKEAAAAIRTVGPEGIGVAALMNKVGLTHGGFYAHFDSKDNMVAEAIGQMFDESYELFLKLTAGVSPQQGLVSYIDMYLSARHRDDRETGCPIPSLSGDLARMSTPTRERFFAGFERLRRGIAKLLKQSQCGSSNRLADSMLAEMVGAVAISRAIRDTPASTQVLEAARESIKSRLGLEKL